MKLPWMKLMGGRRSMRHALIEKQDNLSLFYEQKFSA